MARLEDIREGLYRRDGGEPEGEHHEPAPPRRPEPLANTWEAADEPAPPTLLERAYRARLRAERMTGRTLLAVGLAAVAAVSAFIGYTILFGRAEVTLEVVGPREVTAGEPTLVTVRVSNRGSVGLEESVVTLTLPPGTIVGDERSGSFGPVRERMDIGEVPASGSVQRELRVRFLGTLRTPLSTSALLLYRPENISSKLTRQAEYSAAVVRVPVAVTIESPERVSSGQALTLVIGVDAETSVPLPDLTLGVEFPAGFSLAVAEPASQPAGGFHLWPIAHLEAGTSTKITLRGVIAGDPEEAKAFRVRLGRYYRAGERWLLLTEATGGPTIASPFLLAQSSLGGNRRGTLTLGTPVEGAVRFKNNLADRIEHLTVTVSFPERFVALESVRAEHGFYDATRRAITWNSASEPRLAALAGGEESTLAFAFDLKPTLPPVSFAEKNIVFPLTTTIDAAAAPPAYRGVILRSAETIEFKVESRLALTASAAYRDAVVPSGGPLPPKVRETTTYTALLRLSSGVNDIRNVEVRGKLAGGVEFRSAVSSDVGTVEFNAAGQEVIWRIRELAAATGTLRPHVAALIQLALTPAENQIGTSPALLQNIAVTGTDTFTNTELHAEAGDLTTELTADPRSNSTEWRVVE